MLVEHDFCSHVGRSSPPSNDGWVLSLSNFVRARSSKWYWKAPCSASLRTAALSRHYTNRLHHATAWSRGGELLLHLKLGRICRPPRKDGIAHRKDGYQGSLSFVFLITPRVLSSFLVHCNRHVPYVYRKIKASPTFNLYPASTCGQNNSVSVGVVCESSSLSRKTK